MRKRRAKAGSDASQPGMGVCILAGGLSERMGRNKARVTVGGRAMLGRIEDVAKAIQVGLRIIRKDLVPRCGPLGGIYTGLITSKNEAELFLACDMPFVTAKWLQKLIECHAQAGRAVFTKVEEGLGFPMVIPVRMAELVLEQIEGGQLALHQLAQALRAESVAPDDPQIAANINTRAELEAARKLMKRRKRVNQ